MRSIPVGVLLLSLFAGASTSAPAQTQAATFVPWQASLPMPVGRAAAPRPDSTRRIVGYHQWRGLAIGAGIGGALGAVVGLLGSQVRCYDCGEQPSAGEAALLLGLAGAGAGGLLGFFIGWASPRYAEPSAADSARAQ